MVLRERLIKETGARVRLDSTSQVSSRFRKMKARLHRTLINRMDLTKLSALTQEQVHDEVARLAEAVSQEGAAFSCRERTVSQRRPARAIWSGTTRDVAG